VYQYTQYRGIFTLCSLKNNFKIILKSSLHKQHKNATLKGSDVSNGVKVKGPVTGLEWPREFQEVKVPRFHENGTGWW
jgi:hypothetical protein